MVAASTTGDPVMEAKGYMAWSVVGGLLISIIFYRMLNLWEGRRRNEGERVVVVEEKS